MSKVRVQEKPYIHRILPSHGIPGVHIEFTTGEEAERTHLRSPKSPNPGMINFFSFRPLSTHPVIYHVMSSGQYGVCCERGECHSPLCISAPWRRNSPGLQVRRSTVVPCMSVPVLYTRRGLVKERRTKLMKMIFSSGTPLSLSTSTALIAEPPVANRKPIHEFHHLGSNRAKTDRAWGPIAAHSGTQYHQVAIKPLISALDASGWIYSEPLNKITSAWPLLRP